MRPGSKKKRTSDVFGVSNKVLTDSYVDRGELDEAVSRLAERRTHIALRGESKCGKSWLRQTVLPDAIVVQCRLGKTCTDIYRDALSALDIRLEVEKLSGSRFTGTVEAQGDVGLKILARLGVRTAAESSRDSSRRTVPAGRDIGDLRFIADILNESGRRLVIEDFHYLSHNERRTLAFDLKAFWDYGVFATIVGVWSEQNILLYLNPDLTGRVEEVPIVWNDRDLREIFRRGGQALNVEFSDALQTRAIEDCYENAGILQTLILSTLDGVNVHETCDETVDIDDIGALETAAMGYADQLNPLYQQFAKRVSRGIRTRRDATGIYAHALAVIVEAPDDALLGGLSLDWIFEQAHNREPRITKGNLHTVLCRIEGLQADEDGRGLVLAYNEAHREISVVDRQLLVYRKYSTVTWPWEELIREAAERPSPDAQSGDNRSAE